MLKTLPARGITGLWERNMVTASDHPSEAGDSTLHVPHTRIVPTALRFMKPAEN